WRAARGGMMGMSRAVAREVASRHVTVTCTAPGFIETAMTGALNDKQRESLLATVPAGRLGTSAEVAAAVVFLASAEAAYVTRQTLHVNGGVGVVLTEGCWVRAPARPPRLRVH